MVELQGRESSELPVCCPDASGTVTDLEGLLARHRRGSFTETDVVLASGQTSLAGTFTQPTAQTTSALVLLGSGSGEIDRDADHHGNGANARAHRRRTVAA